MSDASPNSTSMPRDEYRVAGSLAHLSALAGYLLPIPLANLAGPIAFYFIYREESQFVAFHALQAIYLQVIALFVVGGAIVGTVLTCGLGYFIAVPTVAVLGVVMVVLTIIGGVRAGQGRMDELWIVGPWARERLGI